MRTGYDVSAMCAKVADYYVGSIKWNEFLNHF